MCFGCVDLSIALQQAAQVAGSRGGGEETIVADSIAASHSAAVALPAARIRPRPPRSPLPPPSPGPQRGRPAQRARRRRRLCAWFFCVARRKTGEMKITKCELDRPIDHPSLLLPRFFLFVTKAPSVLLRGYTVHRHEPPKKAGALARPPLDSTDCQPPHRPPHASHTTPGARRQLARTRPRRGGGGGRGRRQGQAPQLLFGVRGRAARACPFFPSILSVSFLGGLLYRITLSLLAPLHATENEL